jgi:hypothetical protein
LVKYPTPLLLAAVATSRITGIDWVVIALHFSILLCVAWWLVVAGEGELKGI